MRRRTAAVLMCGVGCAAVIAAVAPRAQAQDRANGPLLASAVHAGGLKEKAPGGNALLDQLEQRLAVEEAARAEVTHARYDARLDELLADLRDPSSRALNGLGARDMSAISGEDYLRDVCLPDLTYATIERHGVDKYAYQQAKRYFRKVYSHDVNVRCDAPHVRMDQIEDEMWKVNLALDESRDTWRRPFPLYWNGNPYPTKEQRIVLGEHLDVMSLGGLSLDNELKVRYDATSAFVFDRREGRPSERIEAVQRSVGEHSRNPSGAQDGAPSNAFLRDDTYAVTGRIGVKPATSLSGRPVDEVWGSVDVTILDTYDRRPILDISLDASVDGQTGEKEVSLLCSLVQY